MTPIAETLPDIRCCRCSGCSARHHRTGAGAVARWYLDPPRKRREEVCGTCANRRKAQANRTERLTPMPAQGRVLVGRVIAGLPISGVDALEQLVCECYDQGCACGGSCTGLTLFLWGGVEHEDWQYLCRVCCLRLLERGGPATGEEEPGVDRP